MPQFQQPAFDPQQFLQWQQLQQTSQMQQPQFQQTQEDLVESPSKAKPQKKKPSKMMTQKNDEISTPTSRQKWPQSDEVLLAQGVISTSMNPIIGNNQNAEAYWGKIEKYYNENEPVVPRDAHNLRTHWHMFKCKVNRFNELYLQVKSRYKSGWSDDKYIQEARQLYINDPSNKTSATFTYEHVWNVVKEHGKYNSATHVHGFQPPKRTKSNSSRGYTRSASDANFGQASEFTISLKDVDNEDSEVQVQQVAPTCPTGRNKAKAKLKGKAGIESSEYDMRKLKLIDEISSTNRAKNEAITKFEHRIDKFYEIEQKKLEMKQKKMLLLDTTNMNPDQQAEHEAMCAEIREKYGYNRI
ncbi:glutathione S-transferase T3-like [Helianthus annuus]|uniref:glutathione S-transferase T3-like n=1 Tax=Helianthus annuus TaxID=4232 RepID=UPI000B8F07B7|nr:glutathione S-transferase T3-like [Helianthus annuus]